MTVNGRFALHCVVQAFCGILGWKNYAIANGLMSALFIIGLGRLSRVNIWHTGNMAGMVMLTFVLYLPMRFDPAYQIGYLWTGTAMLWWLNLWWQLNKRSIGVMALAALTSLLAGSLHEAFSIAIGGGILIWCVNRKMHMSRQKWVLSVFFAAGACIELAAPGNFTRLHDFRSEGIIGTISTFFMQLPMFWVLCGLGTIMLIKKIKIEWRSNILYLGGALLASITFICMGITYGYATQGIGLLLCVVCAEVWNRLYSERYNVALPIAAIVVIVAMGVAKECNEEVLREKYSQVYAQYLTSSDGIIHLLQPWYGAEYRSAQAFALPYKWVRGSNNPHAPVPRIWPEELLTIDQECDTNMLVDLGFEGWLMVQSHTHPAKFILHRHILGIPAGERAIDFSSEGLDFVTKQRKWSAASYVNEHTPFMTVRIEMIKE